MDETQFHLARGLFRARIDSLRQDVRRCFWPVADPGAPAPALFPAVMYCFATLDYFSSFWRGWNQSPPAGQSQNKRMTDFLGTFLLYPRKEAFIAISLWRHKLMHTSEPRILTANRTPQEVYGWRAGLGVHHHLRLEATSKANEYILGFDCGEFVRDLDEGIFGPCGYFTVLRGDPTLQKNYLDCYKAMDGCEIDFAKVGL